jgi:cell division protein FtsL
MSEQKPEKKVVSRTVAIAIGIIAIVLAIGLIGAMAYYTLVVSNRDGTIISRNNQIASLNFQIENQNSTISSLNTELSGFQDEVNNIHILSTENATVGTENSTVWVDNKTEYVGEGNFPEYASSSGYVLVLVSSNNNSTYVRLINFPYPFSMEQVTIITTGYNRTIQVSYHGTVVFPVLSGSVFVEVGNSNEATIITVTIIYCY